MDDEAPINIYRRPRWTGRLRKLSIYIDNKEIGVIGPGQQENFKIPPGNHIVSVKDQYGALAIPIETQFMPNSSKSFECGIVQISTIVNWLAGTCLIYATLSFFRTNGGLIFFCVFIGLLTINIIERKIGALKPGSTCYLHETDYGTIPA